MPSRKVDIVFCLDTSESMKPCIDAVRANIGRLLTQLQQAHFDWRLDFVAHCMPGRHIYRMLSVAGGTTQLLYRSGNAAEHFFTQDVEAFRRALGELEVCGDEDMLCALDTAIDFPFGPANETQRVVILISDEPFETNEEEAFQRAKEKVEAIMEKIRARHITFLAVMPVREGGVVEQLSLCDRADIIPVEENDLGMTQVDMIELFNQLGKTISVSTQQSSGEEPYQRALFGQDQWSKAGGGFRPIGDHK